MPTLSPQTTPYYGGGQVVTPADTLVTTTTPSAADYRHNLGTLAVNKNAGTIYALVAKTGNTATWLQLGASAGTVATLTGNTGGAISPIGGNINIVGAASGVPLAIAGSGNTLTVTITPGTSLLATLTGSDGGGPISPTAGNINLVAGTNMSIVGSGSSLTFNAAGSSGGGFVYTTVSANTPMTVGNAYITNGPSGRLIMTLPALAVAGTQVKLMGRSNQGWQVAQNAGQQIVFGGPSAPATTVGTGGSVASTGQYDVVILTCIIDNTTWSVEDLQSGGLTTV